MLQQQKFALNIKLQQAGLTNKETIFLIQSLIDNNIKYQEIINMIDDINNIRSYFKEKNYEEIYINSIICRMLKIKSTSKKVIETDKLLEEYNYNTDQRKKIESSSADIIGKSIETSNKKLLFYDDFNIRGEIVDKPTRINYKIDLLFSRMCYLKEQNKYDYNKEEIYSRRGGFERKFGIKDRELLKRYPLPKKYKKGGMEKKNEYTKKELTILNILFCNMGLNINESKDLIDKLRIKGLNYEQIIKAKDSIKEIITHFKNNNYNILNINTIISNTMGRISANKIIEVDNVLTNNNYTKNERETIESNNKLIFNTNKELLDRKLKLIKDEKLPKMIIKTTRPVVQSFKLTYSRIKLIKSVGKTQLKSTKLIFGAEDAFKARFGVSSKDIIERFPVIEEKYKVKRK